MTELTSLGAQFGLAGFVIAYFIWRDSIRDKREAVDKENTQTRFNEMETYVREKLSGMLERTLVVLEDFSNAVKTRPCMAPKEKQER